MSAATSCFQPPVIIEGNKSQCASTGEPVQFDNRFDLLQKIQVKSLSVATVFTCDSAPAYEGFPSVLYTVYHFFCQLLFFFIIFRKCITGIPEPVVHVIK